MDRSRFKRPATQTQRQITKNNTFGNQPLVSEVLSARPSIARAVINHELLPAAPAVQRTSSVSNVQTVNAGGPATNAAAANVALSTRLTPASRPTPAPRQPVQPLRIDMSLPGEESPARLQAFFGRTKWQTVRRWAFRGVAVCLVLGITTGGLLFSQSYSNVHKVFKGTTGTAEALKKTVNPDLLKGEGSGRVNILLLGRGGGTHQAPDLTDTIMVASIDPVNRSAILLSVPRDLWVTVPGHGVMKLNAAWQTGVFSYLGKNINGTTDPKAITAGFELVDQTVQDVLGLEINYNVLVTFQAFQQAVDTVGGVNLTVPTDLVDPTMAWENGNDPVLAHAGLQSFDGQRALIYVRSRETSSDFARAERQRAMLVALKSKVISLGTLSNPLKISALLNAFGSNVQTDLSLKNAQRLYDLTKDIADTGITSLSLADPTHPYVTTGNMNGQSVVLPKAGLFNYNDIRAFVRGQLKDPYLLKEKARIVVLNGSTVPGVATKVAEDLKSYGYNITGTGNTPNSGWTETGIYDLSKGRKKYTKHYLEQRFGITAKTKIPDTTIPTNSADFVIIIGSDEASTPQP